MQAMARLKYFMEGVLTEVGLKLFGDYCLEDVGDEGEDGAEVVEIVWVKARFS